MWQEVAGSNVVGSPVCKKQMSQSLFFETQSKLTYILHLQSFNVLFYI